MKKSLICTFALALLGISAFARMKPTVLTGSWSVTEVKTTGPNASTSATRNRGCTYLPERITASRRSIVMRLVPNLRTCRRPLLTELLAVYGPYTANSGTYEVRGGNVTFRPVLAKNPGAMAPGSANVSSFRIAGNTLTLTAVSGGRGPATNPTTTALNRIE